MTRATRTVDGPRSLLLGIGTAEAPYRAKQAELARLYEALLAQATGDARLGRKAR